MSFKWLFFFFLSSWRVSAKWVTIEWLRGKVFLKIVSNITSCELRKLSFMALRREVLEVWPLDQQFNQHQLGSCEKWNFFTPPRTYWIGKPGSGHGDLFFNAPSLVDSDVHSSLKTSLSLVSLKGFRGCPWMPWTHVQVCVYVCSCLFWRKQNRIFTEGLVITLTPTM